MSMYVHVDLFNPMRLNAIKAFNRWPASVLDRLSVSRSVNASFKRAHRRTMNCSASICRSYFAGETSAATYGLLSGSNLHHRRQGKSIRWAGCNVASGWTSLRVIAKKIVPRSRGNDGKEKGRFSDVACCKRVFGRFSFFVPAPDITRAISNAFGLN